MAFFSEGFTKDKLIVLFLMRALKVELTREQFTVLCGEDGLMQFFELQTAISELEEERLVAAVPSAFGQAYHLTQSGKDTIDMFDERLPLSLRERMTELCEQLGEKLRRKAQYASSMEKLPSGAYRVTLRALERGNELLSLSFLLPDAQSAGKACKQWELKAEAIYRFSLERLVYEPE